MTFLEGWTYLWICLQDYRSRVAYCIPILVNASIAYDVSKRPTPEMVEKAQPYCVCFVVSQVSSGFAVGQFWQATIDPH